jgi:phosphoribosylaminoimidazole-succinocarboxamide synthase
MDQLLYQGKAKQLLATPDPQTIIVRFTDTVTALNGKKRATIPGKGALAAQISMRLFELLSTQNIPTHYIRQLDQQSFLAHKVQIIPLEVVVRHYATGSITKRLGIPKGRAFQPPLVEFFYKSDELGDPPSARPTSMPWASLPPTSWPRSSPSPRGRRLSYLTMWPSGT